MMEGRKKDEQSQLNLSISISSTDSDAKKLETGKASLQI